MEVFSQGSVPSLPKDNSPHLPPGRLAGLGRSIPSSAVSDEPRVTVGKWFLSACQRQSLLQLPP